MISITNRSILVIKPKRPAIEWAKVTPEDDEFQMPEESIIECLSMVFAIDNDEDVPPKIQFAESIDYHYREIFIHILDGWYTDESAWPEISKNRFHDWFDVTYHESLFDLGEMPFESDEAYVLDDEEI